MTEWTSIMGEIERWWKYYGQFAAWIQAHAAPHRENKKPSRRCIRDLIFTIKLVSFGCSVVRRAADKWTKSICRYVSG